jgi:hypothetical protein
MMRNQDSICTLGTTSILVLATAWSTLLVGCVMWRQSDSRLVRGTSTPEIDAVCGREPRIAMARDVLDAHIGRPFPNLTLLDKHRRVVRLDQLRSGRLAVLLAGGPEADSVAWMRELQAEKWRPPRGYDRLVILASWFGNPSFDGLVRKAPDCYLVGWPLADYLTSMRWYPIMFGVSADGALNGYWFFENRQEVATTGPGMQPNMCVDPAVRPVTSRACARPAPAGPARYAQR